MSTKTSTQAVLFSVLLYFLFVLFESQNFPVRYTTVTLFQQPGVIQTELVLAEVPTLLTIPSIGVVANIQSVGLTSSGEMATPSNFVDVAWYKDGPVPGMSGSAVITGHVSGKNIPRAVFYDLKKLVPGDNVLVSDKNGFTIHFVVTEMRDYLYSDSTEEIFFSEGTTSKLNLITCAGTWLPGISLFEKRLVVFTELVAAH